MKGGYAMSDVITTWKIKKLRKEEVEELEDYVAVESPVNIYINNRHFVTIFASPQLLKELAIGHLISEGVINNIEEISEISIRNTNVLVTLKSSDIDLEEFKLFRMITTECTSLSNYVETLKTMSDLKIDSKLSVEPSKILEMMNKMNKMSKIYRKTGGTHVAALFNKDAELLHLAEDVGRHSAIDKVIGLALMNNCDLGNSILTNSGRITASMVFKAARTGIPIIASLSAPINSGLIAAEKIGITLVCFVRGHRMNIYTYPQRILLS